MKMKTIMKRIFPDTLDNRFSGHKISLYVFYLLTALTLWRSQHHLFAADGGAQSIATIPLDTFTEAGAQAVIGVFGLWGLSQLIIGIIYLIVSLKYRAMIPMMYLLMMAEYIVRATYFPVFKQIPTTGTAPGAAGNVPLVIISAVMLAFSIIEPLNKTTGERGHE